MLARHIVRPRHPHGLLLVTALLLTAPATAGAITITYVNPGSVPLANIVIRDATPPWTTFDSASCAAVSGGITGCTLTQPAAGGTGALQWALAGALEPGASGTVTFRVRVQ